MITTRKPSLLAVDDELDAVDTYSDLLRAAGYDVLTATSLKAAGQVLSASFVDLMILDENLGSDGRGTDLLIAQASSGPGGILLTADSSQELALRAMRAGALDLLNKPATRSALLHSVANALERSSMAREARFQRWTAASHSAVGLIGGNGAFRAAIELASSSSASDAPILILGESGTGKEMFARAIHSMSKRRSGDFVAVNLAAIPEGLRESTLFGHRKGAFSGAVADQVGLIQSADRGTLFLDEIGDASHPLQAALLRAIQEQEVMPVGDTRARKVNVRIVAATHRNLDSMRQQGTFRDDLYYRLSVITLRLPRLSERRDDIPALAAYFADKHCRLLGKPVPRIDAAALEALSSYGWPGNVRELENVVQRGVILSRGDSISVDSLGLPASTLRRSDRDIGPANARAQEVVTGSLSDVLDGRYEDCRERFDRLYFTRLLARYENRREAAAKADVHHSTLYDKIKKLGLEEK
jgi:DNA-binding NtrC family response regulator